MPSPKPSAQTTWKQLQKEVVECRSCKRLNQHCQKVARTKRKSYIDDVYWGKPVPDFGPTRMTRKGVSLLVVGLAPGAHGANRTGRMFTGDRSGDWLYRALYRAGFANQPESTDQNDGLKLIDCAITNACRCAPPDNKPSAKEVSACQPFLVRTIESCQPTVYLALGGLAWKAVYRFAKEMEWLQPPQPKFGHGELVQLGSGTWLIGSYHPSQQNTFTGRLTEKMLDDIFVKIKKLIAKA